MTEGFSVVAERRCNLDPQGTEGTSRFSAVSGAATSTSNLAWLLSPVERRVIEEQISLQSEVVSIGRVFF